MEKFIAFFIGGIVMYIVKSLIGDSPLHYFISILIGSIVGTCLALML